MGNLKRRSHIGPHGLANWFGYKPPQIEDFSGPAFCGQRSWDLAVADLAKVTCMRCRVKAKKRENTYESALLDQKTTPGDARSAVACRVKKSRPKKRLG